MSTCFTGNRRTVRRRNRRWGFYLATSDQVQGLVAQGRTITETIEIARDVAKKLIEAQEEQIPKLKVIGDNFDYPLVVGL